MDTSKWDGGGGLGAGGELLRGSHGLQGGNGVKISHCQQSIRRGLSENDCLGGGESLEYYRALGGNNNRLLTKTLYFTLSRLRC